MLSMVFGVIYVRAGRLKWRQCWACEYSFGINKYESVGVCTTELSLVCSCVTYVGI